jgi:hypothetical protein
MEKNHSTADELKTIRKIMEESTRFLSLSGLSGVFIGFFALTGAVVARYFIIGNWIFSFTGLAWGSGLFPASHSLLLLLVDAKIVLILSLAFALFFSLRKAKRSGLSFWTPVSRRLLVNLFIPLATGGLFALILVIRNEFQLIIPVFLIFYGLGLVSVGKFTFSEVFYLGLLELALGLACALFPQYGLIFWMLGFGLLHIVYGLFIYRKYEL